MGSPSSIENGERGSLNGLDCHSVDGRTNRENSKAKSGPGTVARPCKSRTSHVLSAPIPLVAAGVVRATLPQVLGGKIFFPGVGRPALIFNDQKGATDQETKPAPDKYCPEPFLIKALFNVTVRSNQHHTFLPTPLSAVDDFDK